MASAFVWAWYCQAVLRYGAAYKFEVDGTRAVWYGQKQDKAVFFIGVATILYAKGIVEGKEQYCRARKNHPSPRYRH